MTAIIQASDLTKIFGKSTAVDHISFEVQQGEIFGFLGPNGAGKTTTTRMLTGVIPPDAGTATILGHDIRSEPVHGKAGIRRSAGDLECLHGSHRMAEPDADGRTLRASACPGRTAFIRPAQDGGTP